MLGHGQHHVQSCGIALGCIRRYLGWCNITGIDGLLEECASRLGVTAVAEVDIDDRAVLIWTYAIEKLEKKLGMLV